MCLIQVVLPSDAPNSRCRRVDRERKPDSERSAFPPRPPYGLASIEPPHGLAIVSRRHDRSGTRTGTAGRHNRFRAFVLSRFRDPLPVPPHLRSVAFNSVSCGFTIGPLPSHRPPLYCLPHIPFPHILLFALVPMLCVGASVPNAPRSYLRPLSLRSLRKSSLDALDSRVWLVLVGDLFVSPLGWQVNYP